MLTFVQFREEVVDYYDNQEQPPEERLAEDEPNWVFHAHGNVYIGYALTETELGEPFPMLLCYKVAYWVGEENPWRFAMGESTRSSFQKGRTLEEADTKAWDELWGTLAPELPEQP